MSKIIFATFALVSLTNLAHAKVCNVNVGTVLFTESDTTKKCWSPDNLALLMSRMILQDVLPPPEVVKVEDENFITELVEYFRVILEVVRKMTTGRIRHIMLLALTDVLGGYLNHIVIPAAKYAFYAGNVNYDGMQKLFQLFDELKCFLRTSGQGWAKPAPPSIKSLRIEAIQLNENCPTGANGPCNGLIYSETDDHHDSHKKSGSGCDVEVPLPFFDSKTNPTAIAVPFKTYTLRNIESKAAAYIVLKYYIAVQQCLTSKKVSQASLAKFDNALYMWIVRFVLPHLKDEKFYSAFGGVLRVYQTLLKSGVAQSGSKTIGNFNLMPEMEDKNDKHDEIETGELVPNSTHGQKSKKSGILLYAALCCIIVWFILGTLFVCYRMKAARSRKGLSDMDTDLEASKSCPSKCSKFSSSLGFSKSSSKKSTKSSSGSSHTHRLSRKKQCVPGCGCKQGKPCICGNRNSSEEQVEDRNPSRNSSGYSNKQTVMTAMVKDNSRMTMTTVGQRTSPGETGNTETTTERSSSSEQDVEMVANSQPQCGCKGETTVVAQYTKNAADGDNQTSDGGNKYNACHSSMAGKYKIETTTATSTTTAGTEKKQFVFGYDFQTSSSDSSPRDSSDADGETDYVGNMSK